MNDDDNDDLECDESLLDVLLETMRAMDDGKIGTQFFILAICDLGTGCDENDDQHSDDALKEQNAENGMRLSSCLVGLFTVVTAERNIDEIKMPHKMPKKADQKVLVDRNWAAQKKKCQTTISFCNKIRMGEKQR